MLAVFSRPLLTKPRAEVGGDGDAVHARRRRDLADDGVLVHVDDDDLRGVRHVEAAGGGIDGQVVPAAFAADRDFLQLPVGTVGGTERRRQPERQDGEGHEQATRLHESRPFVLRTTCRR